MSFPDFSLESEQKVFEHVENLIEQAKSESEEEKTRLFEELVEESISHRQLSHNKKFLYMIVSKLGDHMDSQLADRKWAEDMMDEVFENLIEMQRIKTFLKSKKDQIEG